MSSVPLIPLPDDAYLAPGIPDEDHIYSALQPSIGAARRDFYALTATGSIDQMTKELVRLRDARVTGCGV